MQYVSGLLPNTSDGINHFVTVGANGISAVDGLVAVMDVKITQRPAAKKWVSRLALVIPSHVIMQRRVTTGTVDMAASTSTRSCSSRVAVILLILRTRTRTLWTVFRSRLTKSLLHPASIIP